MRILSDSRKQIMLMRNVLFLMIVQDALGLISTIYDQQAASKALQTDLGTDFKGDN